MPTVALATCREFPELDNEDRLLIPELRALGIDVVPAVWDDDTVTWSDFDAVVIRETWDYVDRRGMFVSWLRTVDVASLLLNPLTVLEWNTDKRYLRDLANAGIPVVPTIFVEPGEDEAGWRPDLAFDDFVIKPAVSAGSRDTGRYSTAGEPEAAQRHVARLLRSGRTVMIQPYLKAVDTDGETAIVFLAGEFSHSVRKGPMLKRGREAEPISGLFLQEQISPRIPTNDQLALAASAVACVPGGSDQLLYGRVDLVTAPDGAPRILELELTEPSLFLSHQEGSAGRLARALAARISSEQGPTRPPR